MNNIRIFIEGKDDQRFIDNILTPYILSFSKIRIFPISYAQKSFNNVIRIFKRLQQIIRVIFCWAIMILQTIALL